MAHLVEHEHVTDADGEQGKQIHSQEVVQDEKLLVHYCREGLCAEDLRAIPFLNHSSAVQWHWDRQQK